MKTPENLNLTITPRMLQEYAAGTISGYLDMTGQGLFMDQIAESIAASTGQRTTQKQRGVVVWPPEQRGW